MDYWFARLKGQRSVSTSLNPVSTQSRMPMPIFVAWLPVSHRISNPQSCPASRLRRHTASRIPYLGHLQAKPGGSLSAVVIADGRVDAKTMGPQGPGSPPLRTWFSPTPEARVGGKWRAGAWRGKGSPKWWWASRAFPGLRTASSTLDQRECGHQPRQSTRALEVNSSPPPLLKVIKL